MSEIYGIDVSHWQGAIDFNKVAKTKKFVIIKCSQNQSKDKKFEEYYQKARAAGLNIGVYIYNVAKTVAQAHNEATFAASCLKGKTLELGVWLDLEDVSIKNIGKQMLNKVVEEEVSVLNNAGFKVNIYTGKYWYTNIIPNELKKKYKFWIARYPSNDKGVVVSSLKANYMNMWQYSSKGAVDGIIGNVDMNVIYDDEIASWLKPVSSSKTVEYYPVYNGGSMSISVALTSLGIDGSYSHRAKIAAANNITGYKGTAIQNTKMLVLLKLGKLIKA